MSTQLIPLSSSVPLGTPSGGATQELSPSPAGCPADLYDGAGIPFEHAAAADDHASMIFERAKAKFAYSKAAFENSTTIFYRSRTSFEHANADFENSMTVIDRSIEEFERDFNLKTPSYLPKAPAFARF